MLSRREVIYLCCALAVVFITIGDDDSVMAAIINEVNCNCTCGGFDSLTPGPDSVPLVCQSPGLVIQCDEEGINKCKSLCFALATATKARGPDVLCNALKNAKELTLSAFYKVCDRPWTYANLTADEPLCCVDSKVTVCPSATTYTTFRTTTAILETKPAQP